MLNLRCLAALCFSFVGSMASGEATKIFKLMDNQGFSNPVVAYTIELPQSWTASGEILWIKPCSGDDNFELVMSLRSADGRTGYRIMPGHRIVWLETIVSGLEPDLAQMMVAQTDAELNQMRTSFRNSNCHVGKVTGTDQLLNEFVLSKRPAGAAIVEKRPNDQILNSYKATFGPDQPGFRTFFDSVLVRLTYPLAGGPVEETVSLSWYAFQFEPLDPSMGTFSQQTVVDSIKFAWRGLETGDAGEAALEAVINSLKVDPAWEREILEFRRRQSEQRQRDSKKSAAEREAQRQIDEAKRDKDHQNFLDYIAQ